MRFIALRRPEALWLVLLDGSGFGDGRRFERLLSCLSKLYQFSVWYSKINSLLENLHFYKFAVSDTAFMYMIAALGMLKIYQIRHPDINAHSHIAYAVMACVIFLAVIGVVSAFERNLQLSFD